MIRGALITMLLALVPLSAQETWEVTGGVTSISLYGDLLKDLGFRITDLETTGDPYRDEYLGFRFEPESEMVFDTVNGDFENLRQGILDHQGGFTLEHGNKRFSLKNFKLEVTPGTNDLMLRTVDGFPMFRLLYAHTYHRKEQLLLLNIDLVATEELGNAIGVPGMGFTLMGTVDQVMTIKGPDDVRLGGGCVPDFEGDVDVILTTISGPTQTVRVPGDRVALSASAALANVGTADVPWYRAIEPDGGVPPEEIGQHPYLVLQFYRIHNGVLEQLGQSDVKHAFFSVNSGCSCAGGQVLYVGCGDVYGAGTNAGRFYLAPREELTASTGHWESLGSHFDGSPVDNFRHHGSSGHDSFEHRLTVQDSDLMIAEAEYFFELWYIVKDDINIFNSMGRLRVVPSLPASNWMFSVPDPTTVLGPMIDEWVDPAQPATLHARSAPINTAEGHLRLAVTVSQEAPYRYEYALMNLDFDRQISSFSIPLTSGVPVQNAAFGRPGVSTDGDWSITVESNRILFEAPPGEGLDWGTLANFRFEAGAPPIAGPATLGILESGLINEFVPGALVPGNCTSMTQIQAMYPDWSETCTILELAEAINDRCAF